MLVQNQSEHQLRRDLRKSFVADMIDTKINIFRRTKPYNSLIDAKTTSRNLNDDNRASSLDNWATKAQTPPRPLRAAARSLSSPSTKGWRTISVFSSSITSGRKPDHHDDVGSLLSSSMDSSSRSAKSAPTTTNRRSKPNREVAKSSRRLERSRRSRRHLLMVDSEPNPTSDEAYALLEEERGGHQDAEEKAALLDDMSVHTIWWHHVAEEHCVA